MLTLVSRLAGLVLPASSKYFIDHVLVERRTNLLLPLAAIVLAATMIQAATGYALARVLGVAAQRAVAEMRRRLAAHVLRLPVERFDATQTGILSSRIMITLFREFHIPEIHSVPLSEAHPFASPPLGALRRQLCALAHRAVNLQATTSFVQFVRDVVMDQPYLVLLKKPADDEVEQPRSASRDD